MVKPALAYLDVIRAVREATALPLAAYNVSGEYSAVKAAAANGWLDEARIVRENLARDRARGRRSDHHLSRARRARGRLAVSAEAPRSGKHAAQRRVVRAREEGHAGRRQLAGARVRRVGGTPLVIRSARGAEFVDVDGREYLDFVGSWGPLILGHAHPKIVAAVEAACRRGTSFGAPCTARDRARRGSRRGVPGDRAGAVRVVGHRGVDERRSARARRHRARSRRQVLRLLSRPRRPPARRRGLGARDVRPAVVGGRAGRVRGATSVLPLDDTAAAEQLFAERRRPRSRP